jgi:hypothetical protein
VKKAPLHVEKKQPFGPKGPTFHKWVCDVRFQSAQLQNRRDPRVTAIVHRSTKARYKWQTSYFDEQGASGDTQASSCAEALRELPPKMWRLRDVTPKR